MIYKVFGSIFNKKGKSNFEALCPLTFLPLGLVSLPSPPSTPGLFLYAARGQQLLCLWQDTPRLWLP